MKTTTARKPKVEDAAKRGTKNAKGVRVQRVDIPLSERIETARRRLVQHWHDDASKLLTAAGVPEWVEVGGMPGNSMPHRLEWYLLRRKDVSEAERAGVCDDLNALTKRYIDRKLSDCGARRDPCAAGGKAVVE